MDSSEFLEAITADETRRSTMSCDELERYYGVRITADVARLWTDDTKHLAHAQKSDEWKTIREKYITASRVAEIIGYSYYGGDVKWYQDYTGLERVQFQGNSYTEHGNHYENEAIGLYEHLQKYEGGSPTIVLPFRFLLSGNDGEHNKFALSPDGITSSGKLVEVKCPATRKIKNNIIPVNYECGQLQYSLHCLQNYGVHTCDYIEYCPPPSVLFHNQLQMQVISVPRDPFWAGSPSDPHGNVNRLLTFWKDVLHYRETGEIVPHYRSAIDNKRKRTNNYKMSTTQHKQKQTKTS